MQTPSSTSLTPTQERYLLAIDKLFRKRPGTNPSHQEVAKKVRRSQWAVSKMINGLTAKGVVRFNSDNRRSLEITEEGYRWLRMMN